MSELKDKHAEQRRAEQERRKLRNGNESGKAEQGGDAPFVERRSGRDRRQNVIDRRLGLDRQRGPGRRRSDERKAAEEGHMSDEQFDFLMAIDEYKRANSRPFPTWTEVLEVIRALGYRKVAEPQPLAESKGEEEDRPEEPTAACGTAGQTH